MCVYKIQGILVQLAFSDIHMNSSQDREKLCFEEKLPSYCWKILNLSFPFLFLMLSTGDWTQDLMHTKHLLYHWAIPSPLNLPFLTP